MHTVYTFTLGQCSRLSVSEEFNQQQKPQKENRQSKLENKLLRLECIVCTGISLSCTTQRIRYVALTTDKVSWKIN